MRSAGGNFGFCAMDVLQLGVSYSSMAASIQNYMNHTQQYTIAQSGTSDQHQYSDISEKRHIHSVNYLLDNQRTPIQDPPNL
jgi:hypothetical protein